MAMENAIATGATRGTLSEHAGMVARGEAVESEEELAALLTEPGVDAPVVLALDSNDDEREPTVRV